MRPPCELVVRFLLPRLRAEIAKILIEEKGLSKKEVAEILKVSPASISKYKKILEEKIPFGSELIRKYAKRISEMILRGVNEERVLLKICSLCFLLRQEGELCEYHRKKDGLQECNICSKYLSIKSEYFEEEEILNKLSAAISKIVKIPEFTKLIPEVRANLVMAKKEAKDPEDVAGIPGRITIIGGRPYASSPPKFGASKHTSRILLEAMRFSNYRAAMCIKFDKEILKAISSAKLRYKIIERRDGGIEDFKMAFEKWKKIPEVVIDPGGPGIEPIAYIFGRDPEEVIEKVLEILAHLPKAGAPSS